MASLLITPEFEMGNIVYIKTDTDQDPCIVTGINIRPGHLTYVLTKGDLSYCLYDFEISVVKNVRTL